MIQVTNKIDKLSMSERKDLENEDFISISATEGTGSDILKN
jgi:50S ribosomal subunit-associated GTPase HflX